MQNYTYSADLFHKLRKPSEADNCKGSVKHNLFRIKTLNRRSGRSRSGVDLDTIASDVGLREISSRTKYRSVKDYGKFESN